ncbi:MAG: helix-turn-helix domain-containing protein [Candidatus Jacksonbacteria bacterium]|jgi:excisionase family DNA binding protein|nr:helix-turn-helix domain-containing protein [Candidatus Jacksonbacteria bacterium]MBT7008270.1 helix-turn-helix domain-containing protein [Candidatus Jacksonbacteria bacterium]
MTSKNKTIPEEFYTAQEIADILKVNIMTIYRYINSGKLEAYKFSKEFRIEKKVWEKFLNDCKTR